MNNSDFESEMFCYALSNISAQEALKAQHHTLETQVLKLQRQVKNKNSRTALVIFAMGMSIIANRYRIIMLENQIEELKKSEGD